MDFRGDPVKRPREQVEEKIKEAIVSGAVPQGEKLPSETRLADQFKVSRTTVREALRTLAAVGLITKVPGVAGGSFVQSVDHRALGTAFGGSLANVLRLGSIDGSEVSRVRRLLEIPAAGLAAQNRTADDLEALDAVVSRARATTIDDPAVPDLDISFHSVIAEASHNRLLASLVTAVHHVTRPVAALKLSPEIGRLTVRQHLAIVHAIRAGDASDAEKAMAEHLDYLSSLEQFANATDDVAVATGFESVTTPRDF